ncbi:ZNT2-like protein, partial [Mya arenaria]
SLIPLVSHALNVSYIHLDEYRFFSEIEAAGRKLEEVLGALMSVFVIWVVTAVLVYVAIERIVHEHYKEVKADEMLITAVLGVIFNVVSSSGYQPLLAEDGVGMPDSLENEPGTLEEAEPIEPTKPHPKNINVRAAFIHVVGDIIQSLGVLLAAIIIKLKPEDKYRLADPICTFLFSVLVLFTTITVLHKGVDHQAVLAEATEAVHNQFNFLHTTIQVEDHEPKTVAACSSCQELRK